MRVAHVRIQNILGLSEIEFSPTGWTEVSGANGAGKTSVLSAIRAALVGGHDATLLRQGTDRGEIVLVLDDGTEIKKRVTAAGSKTTVERAGAVLKSPATVIQQLADVLSVNPVEFLRAPDKQRVEVLLQTMPIEVSIDRLAEITGFVKFDGALSGLEQLESVRRAVFDNRTGVNRSLKDKTATVEQLRATLPTELPPEPPSDAELVGRLHQIDAARDAELQRIDGKLAELRAKKDEAVSVLEERIAEIRAQVMDLNETFAAMQVRADASKQAARADHQIARAEVEREVQTITLARSQRDRYAQTTETVAKLAGEVDGLRTEAEACSDALLNLDAYKVELLASLPIPGLEVRDGAIYRNGVAFDRLNTAQQVEVAVEIAKLRAGPLGLICVDGLELLDHGAYEAFRERAESSGLQMVVSRVSDGALAVQAA